MLTFWERRRLETGRTVGVVTKQKKEDAVTKRNWSAILGSPVAWLALFVSFIGPFFLNFRQYDDIRVIVNKSPFVRIDSKKQEVVIEGPASLTFINSGNRSVYIQRLTLAFARYNPAEGGFGITEGCHGVPPAGLFYDAAPFIVNKNDLYIKETKIDPNQGGPVSDQPSARTMSFTYHKGDNYKICLRVNLATPDTFLYEKDVLLFDATLEADSPSLILPGDSALTSPTNPLLIYKKTATLNLSDIF